MFAVVNERKLFGCGHYDFCFVSCFFLSFIHSLTPTSQSSAMPHNCLTRLMCNQTMPNCLLAIRYNKKAIHWHGNRRNYWQGLNFWDHCHFIIAESTCDATNNPWPHKQIEIFLEGITTYNFFWSNRCKSRRSTHNVCLIHGATFRHGAQRYLQTLQMQNWVHSWYYFRQGK